MKMVVEKKTYLGYNNFSTIDEFSIFIQSQAEIKGMRPIVLNKQYRRYYCLSSSKNRFLQLSIYTSLLRFFFHFQNIKLDYEMMLDKFEDIKRIKRLTKSMYYRYHLSDRGKYQKNLIHLTGQYIFKLYGIY